MDNANWANGDSAKIPSGRLPGSSSPSTAAAFGPDPKAGSKRGAGAVKQRPRGSPALQISNRFWPGRNVATTAVAKTRLWCSAEKLLIERPHQPFLAGVVDVSDDLTDPRQTDADSAAVPETSASRGG